MQADKDDDATEQRNAGLGIATIALLVDVYDRMADLAEDRGAFLSEVEASVRETITSISAQMRLDPSLNDEYAAAVEAQALAAVKTVFRLASESLEC